MASNGGGTMVVDNGDEHCFIWHCTVGCIAECMACLKKDLKCTCIGSLLTLDSVSWWLTIVVYNGAEWYPMVMRWSIPHLGMLASTITSSYPSYKPTNRY